MISYPPSYINIVPDTEGLHVPSILLFVNCLSACASGKMLASKTKMLAIPKNKRITVILLIDSIFILLDLLIPEIIWSCKMID